MAYDTKIRQMGGDIWYLTPVSKIDIQNGCVKGVETSLGHYIKCDRVISNVMPTVV